MKQFSKIVENTESQKYFKVTAEVELIFKADNEGEAGYLADAELGSISSQSDFRISDIYEITKDEFEISTQGISSVDESVVPARDSNLILAWNQKFGIRKPTMTEKMEFYHQMRKSGFDGPLILNTLKDKISFYNR